MRTVAGRPDACGSQDGTPPSPAHRACASRTGKSPACLATALATLAVALAALPGCAGPPKAAGMRDVPELRPGIAAGYLQKEQLPDSVALLPPPPGAGMPAFANDEEVHRQAATLRGGARWALAASDADLAFPHAAGTFDCALGIRIDREATPRLYQLVQRTMVDAGMSTSAAKHRYERTRPFVAHGETTCFPKDEDELRKDGSYPSGHTALGWAAALVLVEVAPDRADALLARGRSYGESRLVCNVHWQSDVLQGRVMGAATVARLHAVPAFVEDVAIARQELASARDAGSKPARDCAAKAQALLQPIPGVL